MKPIIRHAGLLASAALALSAGGSALAAEPARKDGEVKVERKVIVMKDGEQVVVSGNDVGRPMPMRKHRDPAARADHLRTILQLRPEQEPALNAFLEATKPPERKIEVRTDKDGKPPEPPRPLTTPERLDREAKMMAERQAAFQKRAVATRAFYGQLTPSQQKVFDTLRPGGGRHIKIMRRGGPDGMRGPGGPGGERRIIMRRGGPGGGPEGASPMPGGMAWMDEDGVDFAMLDDQDLDVQVFIDGEEVGDDDE